MAKLSILDKVLRVLPVAVLTIQANQPKASRKLKKAAALNAAIEGAKLGAEFLNPKQHKAVGLVMDATVEAYKTAGVFKRDEAPR